MAYKFQLGAATLSGSLTQEGDITVKDGGLTLPNSSTIGCTDDDDQMVFTNQSIDLANDVDFNIAKAGGLQLGGVAVTSTAAELNLLDGVSGLIQADFTKLAAVDASAAELNTLQNFGEAALLQTADSLIFFDADSNTLKRDTVSDVMTAVAGDGLGVASSQLKINVDDSSIETNSDSLRVKAGGITNTMLSGAIANAKLENQSVTITAGDGLKTGGAVNLGGSVTLDIDVSDFAGTGLSGDVSENLNIDAAQTGITSIYNAALVVGRGASDAHIDFGTDDQIQFDIDNAATMNLSAQGINLQQGGIQVPAEADIDVAGAGAATIHASLGANNLTLGGSTSTVVIPGNLTVSGTTVEINAAFVVTSSVQFEGITPDGNEISLTSANPTADRTITLPDLTGHVPLLAGAVSNANVTAAEFALLDGGSTLSTGITVDDTADGFLFNDGGTMKQIRADQVKSYIGTPSLDVAVKDNGETLAVGVNYFADHGGAESANLPASAGLSVGDSVRIKAGSDCSSTNTLTINRAGSQTIDGATSIVLESPFAAVELIYVAADLFRVF